MRCGRSGHTGSCCSARKHDGLAWRRRCNRRCVDFKAPKGRTNELTVPDSLTGPDAPLLIHEMHRVHLSAAQHRRRKLALWAGVMTLLVLAVAGWFVIEVVWSLITSGGQGRGVLRWAELTAGLVALLATVAVIPWLRVSSNVAHLILKS